MKLYKIKWGIYNHGSEIINLGFAEVPDLNKKLQFIDSLIGIISNYIESQNILEKGDYIAWEYE